MATKRYTAGQVKRHEVHTGQVTAVAAAGVLSLTLNAKVIQYVCTASDTVATAAAALVALIRQATDGEFNQLNLSQVTDTITASSSVAGRYVTASGAGTLTFGGSGGVTVTNALVQAGKSPSDANDVLNWSGGALPANTGDSWYFEDGPAPALYNWSSLSGKAPDALYVRPTFTGDGIGLPKFAAEGYEEYRGGRAAFAGCAVLDVQLPDGAGFESYRFDVGPGTACALEVRGDGQGQVGSEVVDWVGTNAGNTVDVVGGSVGIGRYVGDVATVATLSMVSGQATVGAGVTLTTVTAFDSTAELNCAATTLNLKAGQDRTGSQFLVRGAGAITTATLDGGSRLIHNGTGTITTLTLGPGCVTDFSGSKDPITITNKVTMEVGSAFLDPNGRVTLTAGWQTVRCTAADVTTNFGPNRSYLVS